MCGMCERTKKTRREKPSKTIQPPNTDQSLCFASGKIAIVEKKPEQTPQMPGPVANDPAQTQASSDLPVMVPLGIAEIRRLFFTLSANRLSLLLTIWLGRVGDALIKLLRGFAITNVEALSSVIYNCRTILELRHMW